MPKAHARYYMDADLKQEIEDIAVKMERSASWVHDQLIRAALVQFKANLPAAPGDGLRGKIKEIKK